MPTQSSGRESRRSSKSGPSGSDAYASERKEKAKSSQSYTSSYAGARRGSVQPEPTSTRRGSVQPELGSVPERPRLNSRTHSAPLVEQRKDRGGQGGGGNKRENAAVHHEEEIEEHDFAVSNAAAGGAMSDGQDEDEVAGAVGTVRRYKSFQSPEVSEPLTEINIAVIGGERVGKTTFVQKALDLPHAPPSQAAERRIPIDGDVYLVRLLEMPIDDVDVDDDDTICFPDTIEDKVMPRIDGAVTLYNVQDRGSLEGVPDVMNAIRKASIPSALISCKCDTPPANRQVDPSEVEQKARRSISGLSTFQTSETSRDSHRRAISAILRAVITGNPDEQQRSSSATRKRAQSSAVRPVSPRPPGKHGHARANSEYSGGLQREQKHSRHDSSLAGYGSSDRLKVPRKVSQEGEMHQSFLLEESASEESSPESARSSVSADVAQQTMAGATIANPANPASTSNANEAGVSFDELVVRLLAQPYSKADNKFADIFLALYRKFAAPGRLLEVIVERFDALERKSGAEMIKTVTQLRYLSILERWVAAYPGDFAFPRTKRRLRTFITKISQYRIFTVAAKEMTGHLEFVQEDDDTHWAYTDRAREAGDDNRTSTSSAASTLIDDPNVIFSDDVASSTPNDDKSTVATIGGETIRSSSGASTTSSQIMVSVEAAQKAAQLLQPIPRQRIDKLFWRILIEQPDDIIAKELTRMDWIMFSSIRPRDLIRQVSLNAAEKAKCKNLVNVNRMIDHFNQLALWVTNFILLRDKPKHRALMLEKFMRIARKVRELNNYNALGAIIAGIKSLPVYRLAATRELLPPTAGKDWLKLEILMSQSRGYFAYRLAWENSSSERIPYMPLHRGDLVSAEEGNATFIGNERDGRINWKKFEVLGEVVVSMQKAQGMPYKGLGGGRGEAAIKELVLDVKLERDEDILYERSLQCEPTANSSGAGQKIRELFKR